jgi:tyrosine-protein phosphatase YwqE
MFELFTKKEPNILKYLNADVHTHLLPGVDDGVRDFETALSCINEMKRNGINKIYITPHFQTHRFKNDEDDIKYRFDELQKQLGEYVSDIELQLAGEYLIDSGFEERLKTKNLLAINDKYLLVEFSFNQSMLGMEELFFDIQMKGYEVILAHPERYHYLNQDSKLLNNLKEQGVYFQSNIMSFGGFYGSESMKRAYQYVDKGWINFLGTDIHGKKYRDALVDVCKKSKFQKLLKKNTFLNNQL